MDKSRCASTYEEPQDRHRAFGNPLPRWLYWSAARNVLCSRVEDVHRNTSLKTRLGAGDAARQALDVGRR